LPNQYRLGCQNIIVRTEFCTQIIKLSGLKQVYAYCIV